MKPALLAFLVFPNLAGACFINGELKRAVASVTSAPIELRLAATDKLDNWARVMGAYVSFKDGEKTYAGYVRFDQFTCEALSWDIRETTEIRY